MFLSSRHIPNSPPFASMDRLCPCLWRSRQLLLRYCVGSGISLVQTCILVSLSSDVPLAILSNSSIPLFLVFLLSLEVSSGSRLRSAVSENPIITNRMRKAHRQGLADGKDVFIGYYIDPAL
ncbi:hypothetical protein VTN02DRAFT_6249 [Thermoascus thermophilus]